MKHKPYSKYKDSGVQWIGEIPEEWKVQRGKFQFKVTGGYAFPSEDFVEEGVSLVRIGDVSDGTVNLDNCKKMPEEYALTKKDFLLNEKEVLVAMTGATIGKIGQVPKTSEKMLLNQRVGRIKTKFSSDYYKYVLNADFVKEQIRLIAEGAAQENISSEQIESFVIPQLDEKNQKYISVFLDSKTSQLDQTIEKDKQLIELLKEKRIALINHVVTKGLDKTAKMKDSGIDWIGEIPDAWEVRKLKYLTSKIGSGITPTGGSLIYQDEGIPIVRSQNVHFDGLRLDDVVFIPEDIFMTMTNAIIKKHDVLLNITGASIGRTTFLEDGFEKGVVNQHVCIIRPNKINYKFLNYILMSDFGQDQIFSVQMGSSREGLNFQQLGTFSILTPSKETQIKIVQYLDKETSKIDQIIKKIEEKITLMEEYKKSLIHHVVTGKVDVRGVAL